MRVAGPFSARHQHTHSPAYEYDTAKLVGARRRAHPQVRRPAIELVQQLACRLVPHLTAVRQPVLRHRNRTAGSERKMKCELPPLCKYRSPKKGVTPTAASPDDAHTVELRGSTTRDGDGSQCVRKLIFRANTRAPLAQHRLVLFRQPSPAARAMWIEQKVKIDVAHSRGAEKE